MCGHYTVKSFLKKTINELNCDSQSDFDIEWLKMYELWEKYQLQK